MTQSLAGADAPECFLLPSSFAQERLWFIDQMDPGGSAYNVPFIARIDGPCDADRLVASFDAAVARHEVLRSTLVSQDGVVVQVVPVDATPVARLVDATGWDEARMRETAQAEAAAPFTLAVGPLLRVTIWRLAPDRHWLAVVAHHAMLDGFSLSLLLEEVSAELRGEEVAPPPVQYADFAEWQRAWMQSDVLERELAWWRSRLALPLAPLNLPTDRPRPAEQALAGDLLVHRFAPSVAEPWRALARQEGVSMYVLLQAAYAALLARLSGTTDVLVGTPIATRSREELARAIGMFVNTVTLRTQVRLEESFRVLLARVKADTLETMEHADVPFERIVEAISPPRDPGAHPVFQSMFSYQAAPGAALVIPGAAVHDVPMGNGTSRFDLWVDVQDAPTGLTCFAEFATACFDRNTVQHWLDAFGTFLTAVAAAPTTPVGEVRLLAPEHEATVLGAWDGDDAAGDRDAPSVTAWVEESLAARLTTPAVYDADGAWSAAELLESSARVATALATHGVGPGDVVGIAMARRRDLVAALLGTWRAGAAYLPLDPSHPPDRLAHIVRDAGARLVLVDAAGAEGLADLEEISTLDAATALATAAAAPTVVPDPAALAYVIYTSGSTGRPKGVEIPHSALVNFLTGFAALLPVNAAARTLAATTISFDIAGLELWLPLVTGGAIVLATEDEQHEPDTLAARIRSADCTLVQATPTVWRALLDAGFTGGPTVIALAGGEPVSAELGHRLAADCALAFNVYGPTETTIWSTAGRLGVDDTAVSIGRPIRRTQAYIVSPAGQPLPPGFVGELVLAGAGLAVGYRGRPDLTDERFVALPFARGARGYRTGDLARWHHDGTLRCLGRSDDQVKVRGHRIELGEIERVLLELRGVADVAVGVRPGPTGDLLLAAWYVPAPGVSLTGSQLRRHIRDHLPDYMVPSAVTELRELPQTPNGKTDRRALPDPFAAQLTAEREAPVTATEQAIARVWCEVLRISEVGRQDTFFDLGGHSLLGVQMLVTVERLLGVSLPKPVPLFRTLEQLARACDDRKGSAP